MKYLLTVTLALIALHLNAQSYRDKQQLNIDVEQYDEVHIYNKHGKVDVTGVGGEMVTIESSRKLKSKSNKKLEASKSAIFLDTFVMDNILVIYINNPFYFLDGEYEDKFLSYRTKDEYAWSNNWKKNYVNFTFDMEVKVPVSTNLVVATHSGELQVEGIQGRLAARNHHDDIILSNVFDIYHVETHHGDILIQLVKPISGDVELGTHHGDIKLSLPEIPSAEISFDSHHGEFYTDFDWSHVPTSRMSYPADEKSRYKTKYKLGDTTVVKMGDGRYQLSFDTHHGDMYLLQL